MTATCTDATGRDCRSELNLDAHLGNANGFFEWGGSNFSHSAEHIVISTQAGSTYLRARLRTQHKSWRDARVNISERVANLNGELRYVGGSEPKIAHSQDFLGEERDFISTAISDTINDLRELFTGPPLFSSPAPRPQPRSRPVPSQSSESDTFSPSADHFESRSSHTDLENVSTSTETSILDSQSEALIFQKGEPPAYDDAAKTDSNAKKQQEEVQDHEDVVMEQIKNFLLSGTGHNVQSFKTETGSRRFVLKQDDVEVKTLTIHDRTLFDQDDYRRDSSSTLSDHGKYQPRCMTPSVVDGEDEYDFLN